MARDKRETLESPAAEEVGEEDDDDDEDMIVSGPAAVGRNFGQPKLKKQKTALVVGHAEASVKMDDSQQNTPGIIIDPNQ